MERLSELTPGPAAWPCRTTKPASLGLAFEGLIRKQFENGARDRPSGSSAGLKGGERHSLSGARCSPGPLGSQKLDAPVLIGAAFEFKQVDGFLIGKLMNAGEAAFWQTARIDNDVELNRAGVVPTHPPRFNFKLQRRGEEGLVKLAEQSTARKCDVNE